MKIFDRDYTAEKRYYDGTHRMRAPAQTFEEYSRFMPEMGITRIANVTGLDRIGFPVYVAIRPNSRALATAQGKGETLEAARTSALMESIEGWHGERTDGTLCYASYTDLRRRTEVADIASIGLRYDSTIQPDRPMLWIQGWDLMRQSWIWCPYEAVSTNFVDSPNDTQVFIKSTNGLASGNHMLEAIVHGLNEVVERDAVTLWSLTPQALRSQRKVRLRNISSGHLADLLERLDALGIAAAAWDITTDTGMTAYTCTIMDDPESEYWRGLPTFSGHGCHAVAEIALSRAIHEAVQSRLTIISGSRDDIFPRDYAGVADRSSQAAGAAGLREEGCMGLRDSGTITSRFEDDLELILDRLRAIGISSVIAVDLSRSDVGIPVVKIVVPGLEAFRTALYKPGARATAYLQGIAS